jgi:hypothetical protein
VEHRLCGMLFGLGWQQSLDALRCSSIGAVHSTLCLDRRCLIWLPRGALHSCCWPTGHTRLTAASMSAAFPVVCHLAKPLNVVLAKCTAHSEGAAAGEEVTAELGIRHAPAGLLAAGSPGRDLINRLGASAALHRKSTAAGGRS